MRGCNNDTNNGNTRMQKLKNRNRNYQNRQKPINPEAY